MSLRNNLDELINWYERHPSRDVRSITVAATPNTIKKFCRKKRGGPFMYRGREIVPSKLPRKALPPSPVQQEITT